MEQLRIHPQKGNSIPLRRTLWEMGRRAFCLGGGFLLSDVTAYSLAVSLGTALFCALPWDCALYGATGTALGILIIKNSAPRIRALAVLGGTVALRGIIQKCKPALDTPKINALALLATESIGALATVSATGFSLNGILIYGAQAVLSAVCVPLFADTLQALHHGFGSYLPNRHSLACVVISGAIVLLTVTPWNVGGFHPAGVAAGLGVMLAACLGGMGMGTVAGACVALAQNAGGTEPQLCLAFPLMGFLCALGGQKQPLCAALACGVGLLFALLNGKPEGVFLLTEIALGALILLALPASRMSRLRVKIVAPELSRLEWGYLQTPEMLRGAAAALQRVSTCVSRISDKMDAVTPCADELTEMRTRERVCAECPLYQKPACPEREDFHRGVQILRQTGTLSVQDMRPRFAAECPRIACVCETLLAVFEDACAYDPLLAQQEHCRTLACGLFSSVSRALGDVSLQISDGERSLFEKERLAVGVLHRLGADPLYLHCTAPVKGALNIKITVKLPRTLSPGRLAGELGNAFGLSLCVAGVTETEQGTCLLLRRKPLYTLRLGSAFQSAENGAFCGDYFDTFSDGNRACIVLSDGMGTGARAAVDAALTVECFSRLTKGGFSADTALDITNTALNLRAGEEAAATLDVARVNLFTGETALLKAGSARSIYTVGGRVREAELVSVPLGILPNAQFARRDVTLQENDVLLLMSDGVCENGTKWITDALRESEGIENAGEFARELLNTARMRNRGRQDDMTVVAAVLKRNG